MSEVTVRSQGMQVGRAWIEVDYEARAIYVSLQKKSPRRVTTEEVTPFLLLDRDANGDIVGIEILA